MKKKSKKIIIIILALISIGLVFGVASRNFNKENERPKEMGFTVNASNIERVYVTDSINNKEKNRDTQSFVKKADIPTENVDGWAGYNDAIKFENITEPTYVFVELDYTTEELKELLKDSKNKSVQFTYMVNTTSAKVKNSCSDEVNIYSLLSACGYHTESQWQSNNTDLTALPLNIWQKELVSIEDFYKAIIKENQLMVTRLTGGSVDNPIDFYLGSISFVKDDSTSYVPYKGAINFVPSAEANARAYTMTSVSDNGSINYSATSFIAKEDIPTEGIDTTVEYGNAIKFSNLAGQTYPFVKLNYTVDELKILLKDCTGVKFTYMIDGDVAVKNEGVDSQNIYSLLSSAGYHAVSDSEVATKCKLPMNSWQTETVAVEDFYKAIVRDKQLMIARLTGSTSTNPIDFYLGSIEFLMPAIS